MEVREKVLSSSSDRFWRPGDFGGSSYAIEKALSRLAKADELRRVGPGIYWRGAATPLGMAPPKSKDLISEIVGTSGIGPAASSAAYSLGLSTQIPRVETIAVPGRPPRPPSGVRFVSRAASSRKEEGLTAIEVALLEVLREWNRVEVTPVEAIQRVADLVSKGAIRPTRIARAARREPPRVREGLRSILLELGLSSDASRISPVRNARGPSPQFA
jgi:hypothetical protein